MAMIKSKIPTTIYPTPRPKNIPIIPPKVIKLLLQLKIEVELHFA